MAEPQHNSAGCRPKSCDCLAQSSPQAPKTPKDIGPCDHTARVNSGTTNTPPATRKKQTGTRKPAPSAPPAGLSCCCTAAAPSSCLQEAGSCPSRHQPAQAAHSKMTSVEEEQLQQPWARQRAPRQAHATNGRQQQPRCAVCQNVAPYS
jgi:hypothetical protein